uniref:Amidophosphoribosyltransferase n=1 Tax=Accipiter nisus TaxID=211598 RepID=A0A8B9RQG0_9AVES
TELQTLGSCAVFCPRCLPVGWTSFHSKHFSALCSLYFVHRGQESAGIVTSDGESSQAFKVHKGMGLINHVFNADSLKKLYVSNLGIGHTRYSTSGISELQNCQPFVVETLHGKIAVAHNGELTNAVRLRRKLMRHGVGLSTSSDSELITQLLAFTPPLENDDTADWVARIKNLMNETPTSYSLLIMHKDIIYAVRDPYGNRPLCIGRLIPVGDMNGKGKDNSETEGWVVSSESCSFLSIGAEYYREVLPGEIVKISRYDVQTLDVVPRPEGDPSAFCIFEYVYFARPDSIFEGQMVYSVRRRCGQQLAIEAPVEADLVSTVPESATPAALGYAQKCGLPYVEVLCKNRYVGRTFIQPNMRLRQLGVAKKFGVLSDNFKGKRVVIIDDSIVRGNTISPIIKLLRESGAKEVSSFSVSTIVLPGTCSSMGFPRGHSLLRASTCSGVGSSPGCRWRSAPPWTSLGCRGTACLTRVFTTGCRGIFAPAPGASPPPPSALTLVSAGLFLLHVLTPLSGCCFSLSHNFFPFLEMLSQRRYHYC